VETEAQKPVAKETEETVVQSHTRNRGKRKPLPQDLPREIIAVELKPEERFADDGTPLKVIGKEVSEKLVYTPASMKIQEIHRLIYGLIGGDAAKTAPPIPSVIPKGIATPSLLAGIIVNKYADGLPLYRQEEIFERHGVTLSRASMARWVVQAAEACMPLLNVLQDRLMESPYVACDETHVQVLKESGRKAESKSWMWVRTNPSDEHTIVLFEYDPSRSGDVAKKLLNDYKGYLQVDGYGGYNVLESAEELVRIGCNMHGRRKFHDAFKNGAKNGSTLAEQGLEYYHQIYKLEEELRPLLFDERHQKRQELAIPIWNDFEKWALENERKVPPKSKIGGAFHYFINELPYLKGYLKDGRLEADNGFVERAIKYFAIGRNNWLFSDSEAGANASSLFYSFIVTAKLNEANPCQVLERILTEMPKAKTLEDVERLADLLLIKNV
jgi:transposase